MPYYQHTDIGQLETPGLDFSVGDWLIQPTLNRACKAGAAVHLRPQLVDVLVCLARQAGRTVARSEILAQVWPSQAIAETALARCIAELRQALGDNAQRPTIIETIPKRGYRLIAPMVPANGNGHGRTPAPALLATWSSPSPRADTPPNGPDPRHPAWWRLNWLRRWVA